MGFNIIFALFILAVAGIVIVVSLDYPYDAKLFPLMVSLGVSVLIVMIIVKETLARARQGKMSGGKDVGSKEVGSKEVAYKFLSPFVWIVSLLLAIYLIGFQVGVPLFCLLYFKVHRQPWLLSISLTALIGAIIYGVFIICLEIPFYKGILFM